MKRKCNYRPEVFTCTKILREMKNRKGSKKVGAGVHTIKSLFFGGESGIIKRPG